MGVRVIFSQISARQDISEYLNPRKIFIFIFFYELQHDLHVYER